jgi:hypothetical protein
VHDGKRTQKPMVMKANRPSYSSIDAKLIAIINMEFLLPVDLSARSKRPAVAG